jgi:hypothetical protein
MPMFSWADRLSTKIWSSPAGGTIWPCFEGFLVQAERTIDEAAPLLRPPRPPRPSTPSSPGKLLATPVPSTFCSTRSSFAASFLPDDFHAFQEGADEWWRRSCAINKVTTVSKRFPTTLMTDDVACSVLLNRPCAPYRGLSASPEDDDGYLEWPNSGNIRALGVDPGRLDVLTAVTNVETVARCSTKEYYRLAEFDQTWQARQNWMPISRELADLILNVPMNGVPATRAFDTFFASAGKAIRAGRPPC